MTSRWGSCLSIYPGLFTNSPRRLCTTNHSLMQEIHLKISTSIKNSDLKVTGSKFGVMKVMLSDHFKNLYCLATTNRYGYFFRELQSNWSPMELEMTCSIWEESYRRYLFNFYNRENIHKASCISWKTLKATTTNY